MEQSKTHLYDVLITSDETDGGGCKIVINDAELKEALKLTVGDKLKHLYLMKKFQAQDQNMLLRFVVPFVWGPDSAVWMS
jgi:hypothetical protein